MRRSTPRGFTLAELLVVVAVIGIITALGTPMFLSAWRAATIRAGAEEMASALTSARQLAVRENRNVCVTFAGDVVQYQPCAGGQQRQVRLTSGATVTSTEATITFTYLGAATPAATYTVTSPIDGRTLSVQVLTSGRVRIQS